MKAIWQGTVIAESDDTVVVEGNHYFPLSATQQTFLEDSETRSTCPWKGVASYFHVIVNGERNDDAAWWYPEPKPGAKQVKDRVAFWRGIEVTL
jgi:uncharacterized protein (DUF427 family)